MSSYSGRANAASRIHALEAQRKSHQQQVQQRKQQIVSASSNVLRKAVANNFHSCSDTVDPVKSHTVGLVSHNHLKAQAQLFQRATHDDPSPHQQPTQPTRSVAVPTKKLKPKRSALSFLQHSDQSDSDSHSSSSPCSSEQRQSAATNQPKRKRLRKDPHVDTHFLPDTHLEKAQQQERERLKQQWIQQQQLIKSQTVRITYSFWDGTGHRKFINCKKGTTIGHFLSMVQAQVKQLRNTTAESLMFIKEDLIIPHHYSFYDFIVSKARGKSGPLFSFDVVEDVRLVADASKEKEDAHAAKVVERRWYDRNRHIFPASRWEVYDPTKKFSKYTIHGQ
ncbi:unnamed protein product [Agarophyton chilense]